MRRNVGIGVNIIGVVVLLLGSSFLPIVKKKKVEIKFWRNVVSGFADY